MKRIWVAEVDTEIYGYTLFFTSDPTREEIIELVMEKEGINPVDVEEYRRYNDNTGIYVVMKEVIDNDQKKQVV